MKAIQPTETACAAIVDYNVTQIHAVWDVATSYAKGDLVVLDGCGAIVYESLTSSNVGNDPETSTLDWLPVGVSNYFAMFDNKIGTQTENADSINVAVEFTSIVNAVGLINLVGSTVQFQAWRADQDYMVDTPAFDETIQLRDYGVSSWYEYVTYIVKQKRNYVNFQIPTFIGGTGRMILNSPGSTAKLGSLIYGSQFIIGETLTQVGVGIKDFSTKETNSFGNYQIVEREFNDKITFKVLVENANRLDVKNFLTDNRATPVLWGGDEDVDVTITYGFYNDFTLNISQPAWTDLDLTIESI